MTVKSLACTKDSIIRSANYGSGQDVHNIAGDEAGATVMSLLEFEALPSITSLTYARLYMRRSTGSPPAGHDTPNLAAQVIPGRITGDWTEGSWPPAGDHSYSSGNAVVYPGPAVTNELSARGSQPAAGAWWYVDVTALVQDWLNGSAKKGIRIKGASSADVCFDSRHAGTVTNRPYLELSYGTNSVPNIPTDLTPTGDAVAGSTSGTSLTMTARHGDPDGDAATGDWFQVFPDSSTDAAPGSVINTAYTPSGQSTANGALRTRTVSALPARTFVKWRAKFRDHEGWGAFSLLQRVKTAYTSSAPGQPAATAGTLTPDFFGSIVSSDTGDFITAAEVNVYQDPAKGQTITKWASGKTTIGGSPTRFQLPYGGSPLAFGTQYRWVARLWNRDDAVTEFTGNQYLTPASPTGPAISPSGVGTKQNTVTPSFTLTRIGGGNFDQYRMRWYNEAGTLLSDTGVVGMTSATSKVVVTPAALWDWGQQPKVDAAIRNTGDANIGPFSEFVTVRINATPGSPYPLSVPSAGVVLRADGVWVIDLATPVVRLPFRDTDKDLGYAEAPGRREVEIRTLADAHFGASPYIITTGITDDFTAPTLTVETTYKVRGRYDDNAAVRSAWSDYLFIKRSAKPTLGTVTPAAAAAITDPTPTIAWTFASTGSKAQAAYRVTATVAGVQVHDSGWRSGTAASYTLPPNILATGATVSWTLDVRDTDGLEATQIARTFTTTFTQAPEVTGLTATAEPDSSSILVAWTASTLPAAEFYAYYVEYRVGADWIRIATILAQASVAYRFSAAPHNVEAQIRVRVDNGYMISNGATIVLATVTKTGYWRVGAGSVDELQYVGGHNGEPRTLVEEFDPPFGGTIVQSWGTAGYRGQFRLTVPPESGLLAILREDKRMGRTVALKFWQGDLRFAKIVSVPDAVAAADFTDVQLAYVEVTPLDADYGAIAV